VAQETLVLMVRGPAGEALRERLAAGPFDFRSAPHALFSARGEGVTATLYRSGKLVVQGADPAGFAQAWVGAAPAARSRSAADDGLPTLGPGPTIGSDESGKGDWFGPLVVAAVRVTLEQAEGLAQGEVRDS
jgi:ribonuclease HIII